jgi:hypothetical protein
LELQTLSKSCEWAMGNRAMPAAMRRVSSRVSRLAAAPAGLLLEIDAGERLLVRVPENEARLGFFDRPGRREAAIHAARFITTVSTDLASQ